MTIVCQYQYKVHAKVTVYLLIIDHYLWCKQSLHYREVVMGRWKFEYAAIQRKIPLSLSNFQRLKTCKNKENEKNSHISDLKEIVSLLQRVCRKS